jgi:hypothetical protein
MSNRSEGLDFSLIRFPSDSLTLGALRARFPELIDRAPGVPFFNKPKEAGLADLIWCERVVAEHGVGGGVHLVIYGGGKDAARDSSGYDSALDEEYRGSVESLREAYVTFGLASGPESAQQLIRSIETQVAELSESRVSPRP